jgi:hypothetical protein
MLPPTPVQGVGKQLIVTPDGGLISASPSASTVCSTPYVTPHSDESFDALNTACIGDSPAPHLILSFPPSSSDTGADRASSSPAADGRAQTSADSLDLLGPLGDEETSATMDAQPAPQCSQTSIADHQSIPLENQSPLLDSQATDEFQVESQPLSVAGFRCRPAASTLLSVKMASLCSAEVTVRPFAMLDCKIEHDWLMTRNWLCVVAAKIQCSRPTSQPNTYTRSLCRSPTVMTTARTRQNPL